MKTLKQCKQEKTEYLIQNEGMTSEFDMSINDISRNIIKAMKREQGVCFLGNVNLYGDNRGKPFKLTEYTGQKIYNFVYDFCLPCHDTQIEKMITDRDQTQYTGTKDDCVMVSAIMNRIEQLNGINLLWS